MLVERDEEETGFRHQDKTADTTPSRSPSSDNPIFPLLSPVGINAHAIAYFAHDTRGLEERKCVSACSSFITGFRGTGSEGGVLW